MVFCPIAQKTEARLCLCTDWVVNQIKRLLLLSVNLSEVFWDKVFILNFISRSKSEGFLLVSFTEVPNFILAV